MYRKAGRTQEVYTPLQKWKQSWEAHFVHARSSDLFKGVQGWHDVKVLYCVLPLGPAALKMPNVSVSIPWACLWWRPRFLLRGEVVLHFPPLATQKSGNVGSINQGLASCGGKRRLFSMYLPLSHIISLFMSFFPLHLFHIFYSEEWKQTLRFFCRKLMQIGQNSLFLIRLKVVQKVQSEKLAIMISKEKGIVFCLPLESPSIWMQKNNISSCYIEAHKSRTSSIWSTSCFRKL